MVKIVTYFFNFCSHFLVLLNFLMQVTVQDESIDGLLCIIDNTSLTSLIGLTPKEAMVCPFVNTTVL